MKNRFLLFTALAATVLSLSSCEKESEDKTRITYYPKYTFDYSDYVSLGDEFSPSFTAISKGVDVTNEIDVVITDIDGEVVSSVDTENPGIYTIYYTYSNLDDVKTEEVRTIYVYNPDLEISLEGEYEIDMDKSKYIPKDWTFNDAATEYNFSGKVSINFTEIQPGFYKCDDMLAKWYQEIRNYYEANNREYDFRASAIVFMDTKGDLTLLSSSVPAWGDALDYVKDGHYDVESGKLTYNVSYAGGIVKMDIEANQVRKVEEPSEDYKKGYEDGYEAGKNATDN